MVQKGAQMI